MTHTDFELLSLCRIKRVRRSIFPALTLFQMNTFSWKLSLFARTPSKTTRTTTEWNRLYSALNQDSIWGVMTNVYECEGPVVNALILSLVYSGTQLPHLVYEGVCCHHIRPRSGLILIDATWLPSDTFKIFLATCVATSQGFQQVFFYPIILRHAY